MSANQFCVRMLGIIGLLTAFLFAAQANGWIPKPAPGSIRSAKGPLVERVW